VKNAQQAIVIQLKTFNGLSFPQLDWERLRFFLKGSGQHAFHLYELLFNNVCHVECVAAGREGRTEAITLTPGDIIPVGFNQDDSLIPYQQRSFPGYLLLFEYFCFPEKFLFFDLAGLDRIKHSHFHDTLEIWIYLDNAAKANLLIDKDTFCLNATPVVNLFTRIAEPIWVSNEKTEYRVIPDISRIDATEVFSVNRVVSSPISSEKEKEYKPFYSLRNHLNDTDGAVGQAFWHVKRRQSEEKEITAPTFSWLSRIWTSYLPIQGLKSLPCMSPAPTATCKAV
jgi:type VI secretion system protein ImpG